MKSKWDKRDNLNKIIIQIEFVSFLKSYPKKLNMWIHHTSHFLTFLLIQIDFINSPALPPTIHV